jgi:uncharacterized protein
MKKISRRTFLKLGAATAAAAVASSALDALLLEPHWFKVTHPAIPLAGLPSAWVGARIALLTDLHYGRLTKLDHVRRIVKLTNAARPDVVVFTGDLVSRLESPEVPLAKALAEISAPLSKFAVPGNHDYWSGFGPVSQCLRDAGFTLLINSHTVLRRQGQPLVLAGVDDLWAGRPDLAGALARLSSDAAEAKRIVLCHNPDYADIMPAQPRVDLMLCGHTHGGQVKIPFGPRPELPIENEKYAAGLAQGPQCRLYTSVGLGMVGIPIRFNCRPEIAIITLQAA